MLQPAPARLCIAARRPLINTSYAGAEMLALHDEAAAAGVLLLCEMGLDPGIDHMSAVASIRRLRFAGGTITHFTSSCGGFPHLEANNNPWGYKFSWSPRAVMLASRRPARFLRDGGEINVPGEDLFAHCWPIEITDLGVFEVYPNRDTLRYLPAYCLEGIPNAFRGTLRYPGWCATLRAAARLGLLDIGEEDWPEEMTYRDLLTRRVPGGRERGATRRVAEMLETSADSEVIARLEWAGLFSDRPLPERRAAPLDVFGNRLAKLMMYQPGERDMVVLKHVFQVTYPDGSRAEVRSRLVEYGDPWGDTAMARTVSLTAAIATRFVLEKRFRSVGVQIPTLREIYEPVLAELEERGLRFEDTHIKSFRGPFSA